MVDIVNEMVYTQTTGEKTMPEKEVRKMYEQFRNDVMSALDGFTAEQLRMVASAMDKAATGYTIERSVTDLAVTGRREMMDLVKLYTVIRKSEGLAETTLKTNTLILNRFVMDCTVQLRKITANMVRAWLYNYQQLHGLSSRSLDLYRIVVCAFLKWCHTEGYMETDITVTINKIHYARNQRKALTQLQLEQVRHACKDNRERCIIEVLYSTGCRVSELIGIRMTDIDWMRRTIRVTGKGNKVRTVYINAKAEYAMRAYIGERAAESEYLVAGLRGRDRVSKESIERIFRSIAERIGMKARDLTPHIMRHTMATQAATTCPIQQVQRMLGHSSINTTMIYAEVNDAQVQAGHDLSVI